MFCYGAVEVPDPVPHPGVLHGADQTLLSSQPPHVVLPGEHSEIIVTESIINITKDHKIYQVCSKHFYLFLPSSLH